MAKKKAAKKKKKKATKKKQIEVAIRSVREGLQGAPPTEVFALVK